MAELSSNVGKILSKFKKDTIGFTNEIDNAIKAVAYDFLSDSIDEIDKMIYSSPASPNYQRTKFLRRSHHIRKIGNGVYLIFNDASYAEYVHDGCWNLFPRPWMDYAMEKNINDYKEKVADIVGSKVGAT